MATLNLGRIKPVFQGAYNGSTAYVVDDIVTFGDETFICIQASTGNATSNASYWTKLAAKGTDGTDVGTTLTTQGDILYRDGSGLQRLAKPASTQYLQMTSGGVPSWSSLSSDYVQVATSTLSSDAASIIIDNCFTSTYDIYDIEFVAYRSSTTSTNSQLRVAYRKGGASGADQDGINYSSVYDYAYGDFNTQSQGRGGAKSYNTMGFRPFNTWNQPDNSFNHGSFRLHHTQGYLAMMGGVSGGRQGNSSASHWAQYGSHMSDLTVDKGVNQTGIKIFGHGGQVLKAGTRVIIYGVKS